MRRFYAPKESFSDGRIHLAADETRHLRDVLRLCVGDDALVFDGEGNEFVTEIETIRRSGTDLKIIHSSTPASPESPLDLTLATAMLKGEKFDLVVQKAVELGVTNLVPLQTARCDVRVKDAGKRVDRWRKIALEAAKQSGRAKLMTVEFPMDLSILVEQSQDSGVIMFSERGGGSFSDVKADKKITAIIGPEGGWEDYELNHARDCGVIIITFGGRVLRAETAAISIAAILQHRFGDMR